MIPPLRDQISIWEPFPLQALGHVAHHVDGVGFTVVVAASELDDVPIKVFFREMMKGENAGAIIPH